jgi:hypothetical protein
MNGKYFLAKKKQCKLWGKKEINLPIIAFLFFTCSARSSFPKIVKG